MCAVIAGLPPRLQVVPEGPDWFAWRDQALLYRQHLREQCEVNLDVRRACMALAADDPCFDMLLFGCVFEPRDRLDRPKGWYPMVPFHFQVDIIRWLQDLVAAVPGTPRAMLGRGDGILEKARGMAGSWTCCAYAAHGWRWGDGFLAGFMSYKQEVVDKANLPDTLFVKIEGYLGLDERVPETRQITVFGKPMLTSVRPPKWLIPEGYDPNRHNNELLLTHPTRTNVISGYATTMRTGVGGRQTIMFLDEAAKFDAFAVVWQSMSAVTDHRVALSSADLRFGSGFRDLARVAERACRDETAGPAFLRLRPEAHPERDELWREETAARHAGIESAAEAMAREYDLDYDAGGGSHIYTRANQIEPVPLAFDPANEMLDFCIDPGIRDMTAFHLVKYDPGLGRYGVLASYANNGMPAEFYASLIVGQPLPGLYDYGPEEERLMEEWFIPHGSRIRLYVGDAAGTHRGGGNLSTFYGDLREASARLTDGKRPVVVWCSKDAEFTRLQPRISALRWLLEQCDFNDAPDVRRTLEAIREHRWKAIRDDRETTTISEAPVRTWGHDRVTALEFYAANRKHAAGLAKNAATAPAPIRVTMSGKPRTPNKKHAGYVRG